MQNELKGRKVATLVAEGFEEQELTGPHQALNEAGARTSLISPAEGRVQTIPEAVQFLKHFFEAGSRLPRSATARGC